MSSDTADRIVVKGNTVRVVPGWWSDDGVVVTWRPVGRPVPRSFVAAVGMPDFSHVVMFGASVALWGLALGVGYALIAAVAVLAHEYAHLAAAYRFGATELRHPRFILIGAYVRMEWGKDATWGQRGLVSLAGPASGLPCALVVAGAAALLGSSALWAAAGLVAYVNLINALPIPPLDGSRVAIAVGGSARGWRQLIGIGVNATATAFMWDVHWAYAVFPVIATLMACVGPSTEHPHRHTDEPLLPAAWAGLCLALLSLTTWCLGRAGALDALAAMPGGLPMGF